jgi:hypothetical protein
MEPYFFLIIYDPPDTLFALADPVRRFECKIKIKFLTHTHSLRSGDARQSLVAKYKRMRTWKLRAKRKVVSNPTR